MVAPCETRGWRTPTISCPLFSAPALAPGEMWLKPVLFAPADRWLKPTEINGNIEISIYQRPTPPARRGAGEGPVVHNRAQAVRAFLQPLLLQEQLEVQACLLPLLQTLTKMPYAFYRHGLQTPATDASAFFVVRYFNN